MSNRRKPRGIRRPDHLAFARMFRQECSECCSPALHWETGADLRKRDAQAYADLTRWMEPGESVDAVAWTCLRCGHMGMFGGYNFG